AAYSRREHRRMALSSGSPVDPGATLVGARNRLRCDVTGSSGRDASSMRTSLVLVAAAALAAVGLVPTPGAASLSVPAARVAPPAPVAPAACTPMTSTDLAGFFDSTVPARLRDGHVPGAVVSVVNHDSQLFAKGYGLADTAHGVAFDPDRSLVRI